MTPSRLPAALRRPSIDQTTPAGRSRRVAARVATCGPLLAVAEGCSEVAAAVLARTAPAEQAELTTAMSATAARLAEARDVLVRADDAYIAERATLREPRRRRDRLAKEVYRQIVALRQSGIELHGPIFPRLVTNLRGETSRHPGWLRALAKALPWHIAKTHKVETERNAEGATPKAWATLAAKAEPLTPLAEQLNQACREVGTGRCRVVSKMLAQQKAMKEFDEAYREAVKATETAFERAGFYWLARAARPGVKRRGRPLLPATLAERYEKIGLTPSELELEAAAAAFLGVGTPAEEAEPEVKSPQRRPRQGWEKIVQRLHDPFRRDQKIAQPLRDPEEAVKKIPQVLRELLPHPKKIAQALRDHPQSPSTSKIASNNCSSRWERLKWPWRVVRPASAVKTSLAALFFR